MTDQFQHVMVLTSIIIGLGIAYILIGVGSVIERITGHGAPLRLSWPHAVWLFTLFVWMVSFWWWEFRLLALLKSWTLTHYFFIITYAVLLFLLAVLLLPRDWAATASLNDYFLSKRRWFYPLYLIATFADIVDAWLKGGWPYVQANGVVVFVYWAAAIPVCLVGVRPKTSASTLLWRSFSAFCSWSRCSRYFPNWGFSWRGRTGSVLCISTFRPDSGQPEQRNQAAGGGRRRRR